MNEERKSKLQALRDKKKQKFQSEVSALIPDPIPGDDGERGEKGEPGERGVPGERGLPGATGKQGIKGARGPVGLTGKQGIQGKTGADGKSIVWKKSWRPSTNYVVNDAVEHDGSSFICIKDHKSRNINEPDLGTEWPMHWNVIARKGAKGQDGANYGGGGSGGSGGGAVSSVNGKVGVVVLDKTDVGLGNADNTSDIDKPVSAAQQTAIDAKVSNSITNGVTTVAPAQDAVFDALALKQDTSSINETIDDRVDALIQDSATTAPGVTWSYNDGAGTLTPTVLQSYDVFIYKSTGGQSGNRYNSWSDLMTAITKQEGSKTIQFEQDETIPSGSWNLDYVTLKGNGQEYNAGGYTITFGDNTTISSWLTPSFHSLLLKSTSTTGHICTFTTAFYLNCDTVSNVQSSSSYEFFASSYAGQNIIAIRNSARWQLVGGSTKALFKFTGGAFSQQVILSRGDGAVVQNNTLSSTNGQIFIDIIGSVNQNLAAYPATFSAFTIGFGVYLGLTNVSALNYYSQTKAVADSPYTLASEIGYLRCNAVGGNMTINLPAAIGNGRLVTIKKIDASGNTVTIDGNGSETIDGATTYVLAAQWDVVQFIDAAAGLWEITSTG